MSASVAIRPILRLTVPASGSLTRQLPKPPTELSIRNAPSARRFLKPHRSLQQAAIIPTATVQSGSMTAPTTGMSASAATRPTRQHTTSSGRSTRPLPRRPPASSTRNAPFAAPSAARIRSSTSFPTAATQAIQAAVVITPISQEMTTPPSVLRPVTAATTSVGWLLCAAF